VGGVDASEGSEEEELRDEKVAKGVAALELSPSVELFRKEKRPRRARCDGYFDDDILPSPGRDVK